MKQPNQQPQPPAQLIEIVEKSGVPINEIAALIYHFKQDEIRYRDQQEKEQVLAIKELRSRVEFRRLLIADHDTAKEYGAIFNPPPKPELPELPEKMTTGADTPKPEIINSRKLFREWFKKK